MRIRVSSQRLAQEAAGRLLDAGYDSTMPIWGPDAFAVQIRGLDADEHERVLRLVRVVDPSAVPVEPTDGDGLPEG